MSATRIAAAYIQCSACYRVQFVGNITEHWSFLPFLLQNSEVPLLLRILGTKHWFRLDANAEVSRYLFQLKIANLKFTSYCTDRVCLCYFLSLVQWRLYQWPFHGYHFDANISSILVTFVGKVDQLSRCLWDLQICTDFTIYFHAYSKRGGGVDYSATTRPLPDKPWLLKFIPNLSFKDKTWQPLQGSLDEN